RARDAHEQRAPPARATRSGPRRCRDRGGSRRGGRLGPTRRSPPPLSARTARAGARRCRRKPAGGGEAARTPPPELRAHAARARRRGDRLMLAWAGSVSRAAAAVLFAALTGAAYLALFALVQMAIGPATAWISALLAATVVGAVLGFLEPVRRRVERLLEATLSEHHVRARERIHRAVRALAGVHEEAEVATLVCDALRSGLDVAAVRVVAGSPEETRQGIDAWAPGALVVPFPERPD